VEDGRGKGGQVISASAELLRLPRVGKRLGIHFGIAEHLLQACLLERAVDGGVQGILWVGEGGLGQWGGVGGCTCLGGGEPPAVAWGGG